MFPNSMNNNRNGYPIQYPMNTPAYSYYNPYQNQNMVRNVAEPQYYGHPQQMQPMYFPYVQQGVYAPVYYQQNANLPSPQIMNMHHNNNRQRRNQEPKRQKPRIKSDVDPLRPEHTTDEVRKWIESRKKNYPTKANLLRKEQEKKIKEETGELIEPPLSILEQKLRKKIRIIGMIDGRSSRKKELEKNYLLKYVTNPFKKVKCAATPLNDEKAEKNEKVEESVPRIEDEPKESPNQKEVYDAFKEFQMQISQMENENNDNDDTLDKYQDDDFPLERKCVTQKSLDLAYAERNEKSKNTNGNSEVIKEKKNPRESLVKAKKTPKSIVKQEELPKKTESIDEIIDNLKQRKDKDDSEFMKLLDGPARTSDFKYKTNTLLANLLIDNIFNEKNVIVQCLRYIVKENFFEKKD